MISNKVENILVKPQIKLGFLSPLKPRTTTFKFCVFDIEAENWTDAFALGFFDGSNYRMFEGKNCIANFLNFFLTKNYQSYICFAHNGGQYDFNFILDEFIRNKKEFDTRLIKTGSRILKITVSKEKKRWFFSDSFALLPSSLKKLTHGFGVKHKKLDIDYENIKNDPRWKQYLENDCRGLYEVINKFRLTFDKMGMGLKTTVAQQSLSAFRSMMKGNIRCVRVHEEFIRKSYFGGRCEVFTLHGFKLHGIDINSLYPYCQWKYPMPVGKPSKFTSWSSIKDSLGFAEAIVKAPDDLLIPLLPIRHRGKLVFPIGKFRGHWDLDELRKAKELGYKIRIIKGLVFSKSHLFKEFVEYYYSIKRKVDKNNPMYMIAKLILNAGYGKFSQRRECEEIIIHPKSYTGLKIVNHDLGIFSRSSINNSPHIIPSISTHVTARARLELYGWFERIGFENVYYCDTDSIYTTKRIKYSKKLGGMKLEYKAKEGIFLSPKFYFLELKDKSIKIRMKGFSNPEFLKQDFLEALNGNYSQFVHFRKEFGRFSESIRRKKKAVSMLDKKKSIRTLYCKRRISGIETRPLKFKELDDYFNQSQIKPSGILKSGICPRQS